MALTRSLFEACVDRGGPRLRAWLLAKTASPEDADEILQRCFECAWRKRELFSGSDPLPWLFAIAKLELKYYQRGRSYETPHAAELLERLLELQHTVGDPETLLAGHQRWSLLQRCLQRLDELNRQILALFHALPSPYSPPTSPHPPSEPATHDMLIPLSDAAIAERLSLISPSPWSPARVKMRRHRSYELLLRCMKADDTETPPQPEPGARPPRTFNDGEAVMADVPEVESHPSLPQLLAWLETPDDSAHAEVAQHLQHCSWCQKRLEEVALLFRSLDHLNTEHFIQTSVESPPAPLPDELRTRLLKIGAEATVLPLRPPKAQTRQMWRQWSSLALAASVLLLLVWQARQMLVKSPHQPTPATTPYVDGMRGNTTVTHIPVQVWARARGEQEARLLPLVQLSTSSPLTKGFEGQVSRTATVQLAIRAPVRPGPWSARVECSHVSRGIIPLAPDVPRWAGQADAATAELMVGRPLNLESLGLPAGERLTCLVTQDLDTISLSLVLLP